MKSSNTLEADGPVRKNSEISRRSFFHRATVAGAAGAAGLYGLLNVMEAFAEGANQPNASANSSPQVTTADTDILVAAQIAEALAVTTYTGIVRTPAFFTRLPDDDQGYLYAARQEEMSHYLLEKSVTGKDTPFTSFYYPPHMFTDPQITLNTLVSLEDAFIAAYLVGVRSFSTADLRVTAARIMGIESDHRTLARVLGGEVAPADGGPLAKITGLQRTPENIHPPNNNGYERTLCLTNISQAVEVLMPFVDKTEAMKAGFDTTKSYPFQPFTPHLATPLGDFISFAGC